MTLPAENPLITLTFRNSMRNSLCKITLTVTLSNLSGIQIVILLVRTDPLPALRANWGISKSKSSNCSSSSRRMRTERGLFDQGVVFENFISRFSWFPWFSRFLKVLEIIVLKGCFQIFISWFPVVSSAKKKKNLAKQPPSGTPRNSRGSLTLQPLLFFDKKQGKP